jgi:hypothetical protein
MVCNVQVVSLKLSEPTRRLTDSVYGHFAQTCDREKPRLNLVACSYIQVSHAVIHCLYEVLLHAEGDDAICYAEAAYVAANLIDESVERLDHVRLKPLIDARPTSNLRLEAGFQSDKDVGLSPAHTPARACVVAVSRARETQRFPETVCHGSRDAVGVRAARVCSRQESSRAEPLSQTGDYRWGRSGRAVCGLRAHSSRS